ncbi:hypothetical protein C8R45DRAFT_1103560 [Mycena sanguinolenta]|nr:hypothetical protein C8R45DRAFT_1103560 [Mycena sanguinolenta]
MNFATYSTPHPSSSFSLESLGSVTFAQAANAVEENALPHILPQKSIRRWVFEPYVPTSLSEKTLGSGEVVPCAADMLPITESMELAFNNLGARSVTLELPNGSVRYHFSKIRLVININNQAENLAAAAHILDHVDSSLLLLPDAVDELRKIKISEPLAGFHVTQIPLYLLGCLLQEQWANEDVLNARAELTYFHRAVVEDLGIDPSFIFLPTSFIYSTTIDTYLVLQQQS